MEVELNANGYAVRASTSSHLIGATREVQEPDATIPGHIARKAVKHPDLIGHSADKEQKLTKREREVLGLLSEGFRYKEIGEKLNVGPETVKTHVRNICHKMRVRRRVEAIAKHIKMSRRPGVEGTVSGFLIP